MRAAGPHQSNRRATRIRRSRFQGSGSWAKVPNILAIAAAMLRSILRSSSLRRYLFQIPRHVRILEMTIAAPPLRGSLLPHSGAIRNIRETLR
jgi:hypothetical protein